MCQRQAALTGWQVVTEGKLRLPPGFHSISALGFQLGRGWGEHRGAFGEP